MTCTRNFVERRCIGVMQNTVAAWRSKRNGGFACCLKIHLFRAVRGAIPHAPVWAVRGCFVYERPPEDSFIVSSESTDSCVLSLKRNKFHSTRPNRAYAKASRLAVPIRTRSKTTTLARRLTRIPAQLDRKLTFDSSRRRSPQKRKSQYSQQKRVSRGAVQPSRCHELLPTRQTITRWRLFSS